MFSAKVLSSIAKHANTSREELVTPPLFVEASLKRMTPASSRTILAGSVMKRFAPSTI
jgi:hypothetical protein